MNLIPRSLRRPLATGFLILSLTAALRAQPVASVFLEDLTWPELSETIAGGTTSVLIFSGSVEETGPYVALGKHNHRARAYAERIAREVGHTLVAPIVPAVPAPPPLALFPGTINVSPTVYSAYVAEIARAMASAGFKHIFLLGDHGGSQNALKELAPKLHVEFAARGVQVAFVGDNYEKATKEIEALAAKRGLIGAGHGGLWDVAELWAIAPTAVRPALISPPTGNTSVMSKVGVSGDPTRATPELGREFGTIRVNFAVQQIRTLLAAPATAGI